jgi:hypothetical protein
MAPRNGIPFKDLLRVTCVRVVPVGFAVGAAMETFMYYTGFWSTATRKQAERNAEARVTREYIRNQHSAQLASVANQIADGKEQLR